MPQQQAPVSPISQKFKPTTFIERGAFAPFTSPMLDAARVRRPRGTGVDLIIPNPSGGRGVYILPLAGFQDICRPTVHDIQLIKRIAVLDAIDPVSIRGAADAVARAGFAGRTASIAAEAAACQLAEAQLLTNFQLLLRLVQQAEPVGATTAPSASRPAELEQRAKRTIASIAPRLGQGSAAIAAALEELAMLFSLIGLDDRADTARLPQAIASLRRLRFEVPGLLLTLAPAAGEVDETAAELVNRVAAAADMTLRCASRTLATAREAADGMLDLLAAWHADSGSMSRQLARTGWLLDGWERPCRLWSAAAGRLERRNALHEIVALLPTIPCEVSEWVGFPAEIDLAFGTYRSAMRHEDWRTGLCMQDTIARNEGLLSE